MYRLRKLGSERRGDLPQRLTDGIQQSLEQKQEVSQLQPGVCLLYHSNGLMLKDTGGNVCGKTMQT